MTFLSLNIEKNCLVQQKNFLEYQEMIYSSQYNEVTEEMTEYLTANEDGSYDNVIAALQSEQQIYDAKKNSIESQLEVINAEIDGYSKAVTNNIKSTCKLTLSA